MNDLTGPGPEESLHVRRSFTDAEPLMMQFDGLKLPTRCPACGGSLSTDMRKFKPPEYRIDYHCGTVIAAQFDVNGKQTTNVAAGCRAKTAQSLEELG